MSDKLPELTPHQIQEIMSNSRVRAYDYGVKHHGKPSFSNDEYNRIVTHNAIKFAYQMGAVAERERVRKAIDHRLKYDTV